MLEEFFLSDHEELSKTLAKRIGGILNTACKERGGASFIASGGTSPKKTFNYLSKYELPWQKISVTLSDERWVPLDSPDSNEAMLQRELLINDANSARYISLYEKDKTIHKALQLIETRLNTITLPSDCVLLGMGTDGHTASLFPDTQILPEAIDLNSKRLCYPVTGVKLKPSRITLSASMLLNTRHIILLIMGDEKRRIYEQAKSGTDRLAMPVRVLFHQYRIPVEVYWSA